MMTKQKKQIKISIKHKIWLAIMATVLIIIGALWLLQVVFFEDYYLKEKSKELTANTEQIVTAINSSTELTKAGLVIEELANRKNYCIDISNEGGLPFVKCEGLGDNCVVHGDARVKAKLIAEANKSDSNIMKLHHPQYKTAYSTCTRTIEHDGQKYVILVTTALSNVTEATNIIKKQLIYISIIIALTGTIIAFLVAKSLTKPIRKITNAAMEIANGNLEVDVTVKSHDELKELSNSFSYMTKELAKVSVLQKELIANISHDIRTPLTMIKGYAETIKDLTGDDKQMREHQLGIIISEVNHLSFLVSDVMDLSLMQAGQIKLNLESFNIAKKCREILSRFELLETTKGFDFTLNSEENVSVIGDSARIEQVLYNLINNAVNHIGVIKHITISIVKFQNSVRVEVTDTGCGIAQEDLPLIWDRYYKPYKKTEQKGVGTGLGLSIVKAVLQTHRSTFGVISEINKGSTFWFTLEGAE